MEISLERKAIKVNCIKTEYMYMNESQRVITDYGSSVHKGAGKQILVH